jgi:hypothetical protein
MPQLDTYKHLDDLLPFRLGATIPEVARAIVAQNYGAHRLLSALVHELKAASTPESPSELAPVIEKALNSGMFY